MSTDGAVDPEAVDAYVETVRSAIASDPSMSARTAELRVTQPLLELLGWDLHGGAVVAGYRADEATVGYALCPGDRPRAFVDTAAPADGLTAADGEALLAAMESEGVDRGLLTDGHTVAVVGLTPDGREHSRINVADLSDHATTLARFTRDALDDERAAAARSLRRNADDVTTALTEDLLAATDQRCETELERAVDTFVDRLIESLDGPAPRPSGTAGSDVETASGEAHDGDDGAGGGEGTDDDEADAEDGTEAGKEDRDEASTGEPAGAPTPESGDAGESATAEVVATDAEEGAGGAETAVESGTDGRAAVETASSAGESDDTDSDREYVVRLFDGSTSVGAVGGSAPLSALLQTAELLERQRALLRGLETPWAPAEDARVVLTDEPVGDGPTRRLPTGHYLTTDLDDEEAQTAVEGLASAAGLRVMFQGDWPSQRR